MEYADNGNIESKTGLGSLYYNGQQPHAVTSVDNDLGYIPSTTQQATYTAFGKVETLTDGAYNMTFTYGPDEERWKTVLKQNGTVKRTTFYAGDYERVTENGVTRHFYYLDNGCIYVIEGSQSTGTYYYAFTDHLGSVTRIFNESGGTVFEAEYDAWGRQAVSKNTIGFHRGYTGHEMLPEFGLINMNGRLYDPMLGRFLSPDNYVQMPDFSQSFNRYSYCINNPLKYQDPDGEFWWLAAALIGGAINVAMNIDNIDNGWDFLGYFGVGAAAGALGGAVGNAVAGAIGIGGFAGGAVSGFAGGLSSGFVLGGGNSLVTNGNFDGFFESAITGALVGGATGAVIGGVVGGYSAYKQGNNFWTGKPNSIAPPYQRATMKEPDVMPTQPKIDRTYLSSEEYLPMQNNTTASWDVYYKPEISDVTFTDSRSVTISRPKIVGYDKSLQYKTDDYHIFPKDIDNLVVKYGTSQTIGNSSGYILPGRYNGVNGFFQINLNNQTGIIYHRTFYNFINRGQMYVNYGNERIYFFK